MAAGLDDLAQVLGVAQVRGRGGKGGWGGAAGRGLPVEGGGHKTVAGPPVLQVGVLLCAAKSGTVLLTA